MCEEEFTSNLRDLESRVDESSDYHYKVRTELLYELITRYGDLVKKVTELENRRDELLHDAEIDKETIVSLARANDEFVAENAALKDINAWCKTEAFSNMYREFKTAEALGCLDEDCMHDAMLVAIMHSPGTPATDAAIAEIGAKAVEGLREWVMNQTGIQSDWPIEEITWYANKLRGGGV